MQDTAQIRLLVIFALTLLLSGCLSSRNGSSSDQSPKTIRATVEDENITIANVGKDTVWTAVFGGKEAMVISVRPSLDGPGIAPGQEDTVSFESFPDREEEAVIFWWRAVSKDGERRAGKMTHIEVNLPDR